MFGIGETELVIIVVFAFLIFGPDKLPGMGRTIGRALRQFREAQDSLTKVVQAEVVDPLNDAMNEPSARRRAQEAAQAVADDADLEGDEVISRRRETFAERKARLKAEREASSVEGGANAGGEAAADAGTDADVAPPERAGEPPDVRPAASVDTRQAPATSAAALYALTPRSRLTPSGPSTPASDGVAASNDATAIPSSDTVGKEAGEAD